MKARKMKEDALMFDFGSKPYYIFEPDEFEAFCAQLCLEQREICSRQVSGWPDNVKLESEIEEDVLNAKMPEL